MNEIIQVWTDDVAKDLFGSEGDPAAVLLRPSVSLVVAGADAGPADEGARVVANLRSTYRSLRPRQVQVRASLLVLALSLTESCHSYSPDTGIQRLRGVRSRSFAKPFFAFTDIVLPDGRTRRVQRAAIIFAFMVQYQPEWHSEFWKCVSIHMRSSYFAS